MSFKERLEKSDKECTEVLTVIFNDADTLLNRIAPQGWKQSVYFPFMHPVREEKTEDLEKKQAVIDLLNRLKAKGADFDTDIFERKDPNEINEREDFFYLLGLTVYDIFSNNHSVIAEDGAEFSLGSMRGSGRFIADFINHNFKVGKTKYGYMDFYMGTEMRDDAVDLKPFYEYIFLKLKNLKCDWIYSFPRLHLVSFTKKEETVNSKDYDPQEAILKQLKEKEEAAKAEEFRNKFDEQFEKEFEAAKYKTLIHVVQAYKNVFQCLPQGHPQKEFE